MMMLLWFQESKYSPERCRRHGGGKAAKAFVWDLAGHSFHHFLSEKPACLKFFVSVVVEVSRCHAAKDPGTPSLAAVESHGRQGKCHTKEVKRWSGDLGDGVRDIQVFPSVVLLVSQGKIALPEGNFLLSFLDHQDDRFLLAVVHGDKPVAKTKFSG